MENEPDEAESRTTIWQELDKWAESLHPWERFVLATAVRERRLSEQQIDEAYRFFLAAFGLIDQPPTQADISDKITGRPAEAVPDPIWLHKVDNLKHLNALPEAAKLSFCRGLTIVYGRNGAGKSGFVRVLANACFSRKPPLILPDIYNDEAPGDPSADLTFSRGSLGKDVTISWNATTPHDDAKRITVFDTSVARMHLAGQAPFEFKPTGFDVFPEMVDVFEQIGARLSADVRDKTRQNTFDRSFIGAESSVSAVVAELNADSDLEALKQLAVYGDSEQARLVEVDRQLQQLRTRSVADALKSLEETKVSLQALAQKLPAIRGPLTKTSKKCYHEQLTTFAEKTRAAVALGSESFKVPFFRCIGSPAWEQFIAATRALGRAENETYPQEQDHCLLCHRPLDEPSLALIRRLWVFLESDAQHEAAHAGAVLDGTIERLKGIRTDIFSPESRVQTHLTRLDPPLAAELTETLSTLEASRLRIISVLEERQGDIALDEPADLSGKIQVAIDRIEADQKRLRETNIEQALKALEMEHVTLRHRQVLNQLISVLTKSVLDDSFGRH